MALAKQTKDIALGTVGLNLKVDPQMMPDGGLTQALNVIYTQDGSLATGYGDILQINTPASQLPYPTAAFTTKENVIGLAGRFGITRNYAGALSNSQRPGLIGATTLQPESLQYVQVPTYDNSNSYVSATNFTSCLLATSAGFGSGKVLVAWDNYYGASAGYVSRVTYGIWDTVNNAWYYPPTVLNNTYTQVFKNGFGTQATYGTARPMALPSGHLVLSAQLLVTGNKYIQGAVVPLNTNGSAQTTWITLDPNCTVSGSASYPVVACQDCSQDLLNGNAVFAFGLPYTAANVYLYTVAPNATSVSTLKGSSLTTGATNNVISCSIALDQQTTPSTTQVMCCDSYNGAVVVNQSGTITYGPVSLPSGVVNHTVIVGSDGVSNWYLTSTPSSTITTWNSTQSGFSGWTQIGSFPADIGVNATKMFMQNMAVPPAGTITTTPFAWFVDRSTFVCFNLLTGAVVGRWGYLAADSSQTAQPANVIGYVLASNGTTSSPDTYTFIFVTQNGALNAAAATTTALQQINFVKAQFGPTDTAEMPNGTLTSGMSPLYVGPLSATECGYSWYPSITAAPTGTGLLNGTYSYACVYQSVDDYGQISWSRPSYTSTTASSQNIQITASGAGSSPGAKGTYYLFRTQASGTVYYALGPVAATYVDSTSDTYLVANGNIELYISADNELPNDPCPPATIVVSTASYAAAASAEVPWRLYISKPFRLGHPPEWNSGMYVDVSPPTGAITGLAVMDNNLVVFKQNNVFYLTGNSFDVTGQNADPSFTNPIPISTFMGCVSPQSVIVTDMGAFYQSPRGIELITRQFTQEYIGLPLDNTVGTIADSCLVQSQGQVRFLDMTNSQVWIYDAIVGRWSTKTTYFTNWSTQMPVMACTNGSLPEIFYYGGHTYESTTGSFVSSTQGIITTGWIKLAGLQGFARLYRIGVLGTIPGTAINNGTVNIQVAYNYNPTVVDSETFTATSNFEQFRMRTSLQKVEAIQVTVQFNTLIANTQAKLTGLTLEYGVNAGLFRQGLAQTVG